MLDGSKSPTKSVRNYSPRYSVVLSASLLFHLLLLFILPFNKSAAEAKPIVVALLAPKTPLPEKKKSFVPPSQLPEEPAPEDTQQLSDKNTRTDKEQLARGEPSSTPPAKLVKPTKSKTSAKASVEKPTPKKSAKRKPELRLNRKQLAAKFGGTKLPSAEQANRRLQNAVRSSSSAPEGNSSEAERQTTLKEYRPFSKYNFFIPRSGSPDFLPNIPDGDLTLLNAKADRYAVFVRRVGLQVFGALRKHSWQELPGGALRRIRQFVTLRASMQKDGSFLGATLLDSSGSNLFDVVLKSAANDGTWDQNPPSGAEGSDGNIHFIFRARMWGRSRAEGIGERRWILLAVGLE